MVQGLEGTLAHCCSLADLWTLSRSFLHQQIDWQKNSAESLKNEARLAPKSSTCSEATGGLWWCFGQSICDLQWEGWMTTAACAFIVELYWRLYPQDEQPFEVEKYWHNILRNPNQFSSRMMGGTKRASYGQQLSVQYSVLLIAWTTSLWLGLTKP